MSGRAYPLSDGSILVVSARGPRHVIAPPLRRRTASMKPEDLSARLRQAADLVDRLSEATCRFVDPMFPVYPDEDE